MRCVLRPVAEQTILITGGTDGLGRALAAELAAADATLLVHGRDDVRGRETIDEIHSRTGNENLHWLRADFASLDEVRTLARHATGEHDRLDGPVNNAGIGITLPGGDGRMESSNGYELRFAVNYLAGYLLTRLVLPLLEDSKMVLTSGINPTSSLQDGVRATLRLVADPELDGMTGRYFNGLRPAEPHRQAHDLEARRQLRELSDRLCF